MLWQYCMHMVMPIKHVEWNLKERERKGEITNLHIQRDKGHKAVVLNYFSQLLIQVVELLKEWVSG